MNKLTPASAPVEKTLTEQKTEFTAEGAPPPGKVSTETPQVVPKPDTDPLPPAPSPP